MFIIEFSYNFLYVWNCMKLYDKKFLIYENCMIRSFGQPGIREKGQSSVKKSFRNHILRERKKLSEYIMRTTLRGQTVH